MRFPKRALLILVLTASPLLATGCADDNLAKGLVAGAGAAGGAFLGATIASPGNKMLGGVIGAGAGGVLGYMLGGALGK